MTGVALPAWVDDFDDRADAAWEVLRGVPALDRLYYTASAAGDFSLIWHAINTARTLAGTEQKHRFIRLTAALAVESLIVNQVIKRMFRRTRPDDTGYRPHHLRTPSTSSFPSGHASSAALAASLLSEDSRLGPVYTAVAVIVATSRIHVRIHHASDVIAGAAMGAAGAALWKRLWPVPGA